MIETIIFDADGMVITKPKIRPSETLAKELGIPPENILVFFKNEFQLCKVGKADTKEALKKYLPIWGWKDSAEEFLNEWFKYDSTLNQEIIQNVKSLRKEGFKCYLATNNEKNRIGYFENILGFKNIFDGVFASCKIGYDKIDKEYWEEVFRQLKNPDKKNVLVWDDEPDNIKTIKNFGFQAELYTDFNEYSNKIKKYLTK